MEYRNGNGSSSSSNCLLNSSETVLSKSLCFLASFSIDRSSSGCS